MTAAYVQSAKATSGAYPNTLTITFASNPVPGNTLVICSGNGDLAYGFTSVDYITSATGTTWSYIDEGTSSDLVAETWVAQDCVGGSTDKTITISYVDFGSALPLAAIAFEFSGVTTDFVGAASNDTSTTLDTGSITPDKANALVIATCTNASAITSPGGSWNDPQGPVDSGGTYLGAVYQIQSAATATSATWGGTANHPNSTIDCLVPPPPPITYVQSAKADTFNASSLSTAFGSNPVAGNCLIACIATGAGSSSEVTGITSATGTTWHQVVTDWNGTNTDVEIWVAANCTGGSTDKTVVVSVAGVGQHIAVTLFEFRGLNAWPAVADTGNIQSGYLYTPSLTPTYDAELVIAAVANQNTVTAPGAPWSNPQGTVSASTVFLDAVYQIQTSKTAASATWTGTSGNPVTAIAAFQGPRIITKTQSAVSRIAITPTKTQSAVAKIAAADIALVQAALTSGSSGAPSLSAFTNGSLVVCVLCQNSTDSPPSAYTPPTGYTQALFYYENFSTGGDGGIIAVFYRSNVSHTDAIPPCPEGTGGDVGQYGTWIVGEFSGCPPNVAIDFTTAQNNPSGSFTSDSVTGSTPTGTGELVIGVESTNGGYNSLGNDLTSSTFDTVAIEYSNATQAGGAFWLATSSEPVFDTSWTQTNTDKVAALVAFKANPYAKTQPAVSRIATTPTKTQSAVSRIKISATKTQSSVAHIGLIATKTQSAVSRLVLPITKTQSTVARVSNTETKTQSVVSRISHTESTTQASVGRIQTLPAVTHPVVSRILNEAVTKTQPAIGRVSHAETKTQSTVARIGKLSTKTQTAIAHITHPAYSKTQSGVARIRNTGLFHQSAVARIATHSAPIIIVGPVTPSWDFILLDTEGDPIASLTAATSRKVTWSLDAPATVAFNLPGTHPQAALVVETATDLEVFDTTGVKRFRGRMGSSEDDIAPDTGHVCQFNAVDYRGFLGRRYVLPGAEFYFVGVEQTAIAWQLIHDTQAQPGGDLGITNGSAATGVNRNALYTYSTEVLSSITSLGQFSNGFTWEIDPELSFNTWALPIGRGIVTGEVLVYGAQILTVKRVIDTSTFANSVRYSGNASLVPAIAEVGSFAGTGRWEKQVGDTTILDQTQLTNKAAWELAQDDIVQPSYQITLNPAYGWTPEIIWLGDTVTLVVQSGRLDINTSYRVSQIEVDLGDDGGQTVTLTLGPVIQNQTTQTGEILNRISTLEGNTTYGVAVY